MRANEGSTDRLVRVVIGIILLAAGLFGGLSGALAIVADVAGAVLLLTGLVGFCPLYTLLGINTCGVKKGEGK